MSGFPVKVYIYDLTKGLARQMSQALIGKYLEGVWHTGIVVYGQEFFFGGTGIESCAPGNTMLGQPEEIQDLGTTEVPSEMFFEHLQELANTTFRPECYHLLDHNCNTFSDEVAQFLTGKHIPGKITNLPQEVMNTPFGAMIRPFIDSMTVSPGGSGGNRHFTPSTSAGATAGASSSKLSAAKPPTDVVTFQEKEVLEEFKKKKAALRSATDAQDFNILTEVHDYLSTKDCGWSLGKVHIQALGRMIVSSPSDDVISMAGSLLQRCVLSSDVLPVLTHHTDYLQILAQFEQCSPNVQKIIVRSMCNVCSHPSGCQWLLGSESPPVNDMYASNRKLTLHICSSCLLNDDIKLNNIGSALCLNITRRKISTETAMELGIALIQLATKDLNKSIALHLLLSLRVCLSTDPELAGVAEVMELNVQRFSSMSHQHKEAVHKIENIMKQKKGAASH